MPLSLLRHYDDDTQLMMPMSIYAAFLYALFFAQRILD